MRARKARDYILRSIGEPMALGDIASRNGMSISTLQRVFKTCFGTTVHEFVRTRRLELARLALLDKGLTVGEAAFQAGYSSPANFSTAFQRAFGYRPSACLRG
jgi:AraC-like DNA-binding protein